MCHIFMLVDDIYTLGILVTELLLWLGLQKLMI